MNSTSKKSQVKQKWHETPIFRDAIILSTSIICTCLLVIAAYYSQQKQILVTAILFTLIPGVIFGLLFIILQRYWDNAAKNKQEIELLAESQNAVRNELLHLNALIKSIVEDVGETLNLYQPFRKLLDEHASQGRMIRRFLRLYMTGSLRIWRISEWTFYELAVEGARECKTWDAIHHGRISALQSSSFPPDYLKDLQGAGGERRRIVILKSEEVQEVDDDEICSRFLSATKGTTSYWIGEDNFFRLTQISPPITLDCALHDKNLLLRLDHKENVAIMSFKGQHEEICDGVIRAFEALDLELRRNDVHNAKFHLISDRNNTANS
jgi:hypothetical protein